MTAAASVPPAQNPEAEQGLLGALLVDRDLATDLIPKINREFFAANRHRVIFDAMADLQAQSPPIAISNRTVTVRLRSTQNLDTAGGPTYLQALREGGAPSTADFYLDILRDKYDARAALRTLKDGIDELSEGTASAEEVIDRVRGELDALREEAATEGFTAAGDAFAATLDMMEELARRGNAITGVPTGFHDLDKLTNGFQPGQMITIAARPAIGKALALETPLPTPTGWTTMGDVAEGDLLIDADGNPTRVTAATDVMLGHDCYRITFDDGTTIVADAEHLWRTHDHASRRAFYRASGRTQGRPDSACTSGPVLAERILTTREMAARVHIDHSSRSNYAIRTTAPIAGPSTDLDLPVAAYTLGAWLGGALADPTASGRRRRTSTSDTDEIRMYADASDSAAASAAASTVQEAVSGHGTGEGPRIPQAYLRASEATRRALLAGLLDARATVTHRGAISLRLSHGPLTDDAYELLVSLGYRCTRNGHTRRTADPSGTRALTFRTTDDVFRAHHKATRHKEVRNTSDHARRRATNRYVVAVDPVESVPVRCVQVDNPDHMYLAGRAMVPTHNSTVARDIARSAAFKHNLTVALFSLEMSKEEIMMCLLAAEARIPLHKIRKGDLTEDEWTNLANRWADIGDAPLFIDDSPTITMQTIRAKCIALKRTRGLHLIIIDYLQLMSSGTKVESRQQEVSAFSRAIKVLGKELGVPIIALSQLNRGPEQRADKIPNVSDLRESGSIEQDSDMVILIHREEAVDPQSARVGEGDFIVAKHRNGPTKTITVSFQGHYSRFVDMAQ